METNKGLFLDNLLTAQLNSEQISNIEFNYVFTIIPKSTPCIIRKCARCEENRFASSDRFRINANKKIIDVWLIFKCISCDYTLNVSIISRKTVANIDRTLLNRFHENDEKLAWQYAFDPSFIEKGHIVDWGVDFEVEPIEEIVFKSAQNTDREIISLLIKSDFFLKIPVHIILKRILNVSRSQLEKIHAVGDLKIEMYQGKSMNLKSSMGFGCAIKISR